MKHTQGKWTIGKTGATEQTAIWVGGTRIAIVDEVPHEGSKANATLISKAPELLDALNECVLQLEYLSKKFGETGTGNSVISRAKTLIEQLQTTN